MRRCDVAVIGLGVMGSAALHSLVKRGIDAVGFDPAPLGHAGGSSHGTSRLFRRINFENPAYTSLAEKAYAGWQSLESNGSPILIDTPILEAGYSQSNLVRASADAARENGIYSEWLSGTEINNRFPAFQLPDDWIGVLHNGAIIRADRALTAFRIGTQDNIISEKANFTVREFDFLIETRVGSFSARRIIIAAGPWVSQLVPPLAPHIKVTRQAVGWYRSRSPSATSIGDFPCFILDGPDGLIYGFPDFEGRGVKAAPHDQGPSVDPDRVSPVVSSRELDPVTRTLERYIPGAAGPLVETDACLYTNTGPGDIDFGAPEEFIIDRLPAVPGLIVASPCSGHGFKFAPAIGEMLADMATDDRASPNPEFRIGRFSGFSAPEAKLHRAQAK